MKYISLFILLLGGALQAKMERKIMVELEEDRLGPGRGTLFSYKLESISGSKVTNSVKEFWLVDGKEVSKDVFEQQRRFALEEEIKEKREQEYSRKMARLEFNRAQQTVLHKKLLSKLISDIEQRCTEFDQYDLNQYMAYSNESIQNEIDFINIKNHYLEPARQALTNADELSPDALEKLIFSLEGYPPKLATLFEETVKRAIDQCDDTERLKKFLVIVS